MRPRLWSFRAAFLWLVVGTCGIAQGTAVVYVRMSIEAILAAGPRLVGALVLTSGRYERVGESRSFLDGVIIGPTGARLRVMGPVFDWIPQPSSRVEMWGRVQRDPLGSYLDFFNGRHVRETERRPYVMPPLIGGTTVTLVAKLRQVWILETEDRKTVEVLAFPPGFEPLGGLIIEATGTVRSGGIPPVLAGIRIARIRILPGPGPVSFGG